MSEPNKRDREIGKDIADLLEMACEEQYPEFHVISHYGIDHIIAAYREEIEAKKTVPMAMLRELMDMAIREGGSMHRAYGIVNAHGYEVTE